MNERKISSLDDLKSFQLKSAYMKHGKLIFVLTNPGTVTIDLSLEQYESLRNSIHNIPEIAKGLVEAIEIVAYGKMPYWPQD